MWALLGTCATVVLVVVLSTADKANERMAQSAGAVRRAGVRLQMPPLRSLPCVRCPNSRAFRTKPECHTASIELIPLDTLAVHFADERGSGGAGEAARRHVRLLPRGRCFAQRRGVHPAHPLQGARETSTNPGAHGMKPPARLDSDRVPDSDLAAACHFPQALADDEDFDWDLAGVKKPSPRGRPWALRHAYGRTWQASVALLMGSTIVLTLCGIAAPAYSVAASGVRTWLAAAELRTLCALLLAQISQKQEATKTPPL